MTTEPPYRGGSVAYAPRMATAPRPRRSTPKPPPDPAPPPQVPTIPLDVPIYRYRVLFSDGHTVDFLAPSDHSGYRAEMLDAHYGKARKRTPHGQDAPDARIEGIAHLGQVYVHMPNVNWPDPPAAT